MSPSGTSHPTGCSQGPLHPAPSSALPSAHGDWGHLALGGCQPAVSQLLLCCCQPHRCLQPQLYRAPAAEQPDQLPLSPPTKQVLALRAQSCQGLSPSPGRTLQLGWGGPGSPAQSLATDGAVGGVRALRQLVHGALLWASSTLAGSPCPSASPPGCLSTQTWLCRSVQGAGLTPRWDQRLML